MLLYSSTKLVLVLLIIVVGRLLRQHLVLTLSEPQSRFGDKPLKFQVVCPRNGTPVLNGLIVVGRLLRQQGR